MKEIVLIILVSLSASTLIAQSELKGAAKTYYKLYQKSIEKLKSYDPLKQSKEIEKETENCRTYITSMKKADPTFNYTQMDQEVVSYEDKLKSAAENKAQAKK